jgi:multimeric flavodoxin WrbA
MKVRKLGDWKPRVLIFQGSPRDPDTCANMESKSHKIVEYMISKWSPFVNFQVIDLAVNQSKRPIIQPCKGCISTAGGFHCHFQCSCYFKDDDKKPDLLKELDVYSKLQDCDAFLVVSPIHWHALTSQVKLLFDRLVCVNETLTIDDAKKLMGSDNIKNSEVTGKFSRSGKYNNMLRNHLEGKVAGFYVHGDNGADDYEGKELPDSYRDVLDDGFGNNAKATVMPYVMQLKYSGIYVPNELVEAFYINEGVDYNVANKTFNKEKEFFERADNLLENLLTYLEENKYKTKI